MIYIILPVHNRSEQTFTFIAKLMAQSYQDFHLILVDDGSVDGTANEVSLKLAEKVTILKGKGNWWWGGSLHQAYKWIVNSSSVRNDDLVLIMNNDTIFEPEFVETGINIIAQNPHSLLAAQVYSAQTNELIDKGVVLDWDTFDFREAPSISDINCLSTRGLILYVTSFKQIGGFYPVLLPHYLSDYEFTHRAFNKGFTLLTDASFKLLVDESTTGVETVLGNRVSSLTKFFSKRYKANPIYRIVFILLGNASLFTKMKLIGKELYATIRFFYSILLVKETSNK